MKPITYWLQNDAMNQLVEAYGASLEGLIRHDRRLLIALIALSCVENASVEMNLFLGEFLPRIPRSKQVEAVLDILQAWNLKVEDGDLLIEAIAASLTQQSQKNGHPYPLEMPVDIGLAKVSLTRILLYARKERSQRIRHSLISPTKLPSLRLVTRVCANG